MKINELPRYDDSVNTTGCCPRFNPEGWDGQELHLQDMKVVRATTRSAMHVPLDMEHVFGRVQRHIDQAGAEPGERFIVLSRDDSQFRRTHLFSVSKDVPDEEMSTLSGDFITKVFEGSFAETRRWYGEMQAVVRSRGHVPGDIYFFYTTCPECAKAYGKNYVVGVAEEL